VIEKLMINNKIICLTINRKVIEFKIKYKHTNLIAYFIERKSEEELAKFIPICNKDYGNILTNIKLCHIKEIDHLCNYNHQYNINIGKED
jgi:hypothetical protein